ncbi:uncharacterized protein BYT42DRAFT_581988 [Radiomyces spectabilis]|uniref:uncharacterized protein n=1 Tax=Radiomyces spectabilis TaxID=64574 RepID=UPI00221F4DF9|nr:uncharacterized protein BYT42DRAFT_581988 [Radiomyces spectabilis]KAI8370355.1 hypothetical protein BYT42DRAFT_581988 [Radiomyces spectabilis]
MTTLSATSVVPSYTFDHPHHHDKVDQPILLTEYMDQASSVSDLDNHPTRTSFRRTRQSSMISFPELLQDSDEDDDDSLTSPTSALDQYFGVRHRESRIRYDTDLPVPTSSHHRRRHSDLCKSHRRVAAPSVMMMRSSFSGVPSSAHSATTPLPIFAGANVTHTIKSASDSTPCMPRRKSVPHRSPSAIQDAIQATAVDKSVVFQLDMHSHLPAVPSTGSSTTTATTTCPDCGASTSQCGMTCTSKVICGESLLAALRKRVALARSQQQQHQQPSPVSGRKRARSATQIEIPHIKVKHSSAGSGRKVHDWFHESSVEEEDEEDDEDEDMDEDEDDAMHPEIHRKTHVPKSALTSASSLLQQPRRKSVTVRRSSNSGRPSRVKGPCQACQEASDGCMRKAFDWPFPSTQVFNDKGKPFVYLCNKCGLRYNKSGGCVCRTCRWVFCKEEKRKAMQHINQMRRNRPDGRVDPNEDIENFVCTPKYWTCGRPWKVGWVLNSNEDDETESMTESA